MSLISVGEERSHHLSVLFLKPVYNKEGYDNFSDAQQGFNIYVFHKKT